MANPLKKPPMAGSHQICCLISFWARCSLFFCLVSEVSPVLSNYFAWYLSYVGVGLVLSFFCAWYLGHLQLARFIYLDQVWVGQVIHFFLLGIWAWSAWARWSLFFLLGIWARSEWARCVFFLLGILRQLRGVPADGEKRVDFIRRWTFLLYFD